MKLLFTILLAIGAPVSAHTTRTTPPERRPPVGGLFAAHALGLSREPQDLSQLVRDEMSVLDRVAGFRTQVRLADAGESTSDPVDGIVISRPQLNRISDRFGPQQLRPILRFLLAHEKTHQVQYGLYTASAVKSPDHERRRLYEAQADVLAGKYLLESLESISSLTQTDVAAIVNTLKLAFDLGALEGNDADHPTSEERRTAVRLGMASGMIAKLSSLPPDGALASMVGSLSEKVDVLPGEDVMTWSYRLSKKITHYSRTAVSSIVVLESKTKIDWDTRASNPFVTFSLTYKNVGQRAVYVDMEVQCASVSRENKDDTLQWLKWSVKNFRFKLQPGEEYVAGGRIPWYANASLMPLLVYPPKDTALMSVEYAR